MRYLVTWPLASINSSSSLALFDSAELSSASSEPTSPSKLTTCRWSTTGSRPVESLRIWRGWWLLKVVGELTEPDGAEAEGAEAEGAEAEGAEAEAETEAEAEAEAEESGGEFVWMPLGSRCSPSAWVTTGAARTAPAAAVGDDVNRFGPPSMPGSGVRVRAGGSHGSGVAGLQAFSEDSCRRRRRMDQLAWEGEAGGGGGNVL